MESKDVEWKQRTQAADMPCCHPLREWVMNFERYLLRVVCCLVLLTLAASAQSTDNTQGGSASAPEERKVGDYLISQSVEFGYRFTETSGPQATCAPGSPNRSSAGLCQDQSMYNSLVNLHTGPRLLEQTLSLRAPGNTGGLFDRLYLNTFGFGGDPNDVARLRISKRKVYNLNVTFRRDLNVFNYDLLANPLNPGTLNTSASVFQSPANISLIPGTGANQFLVGNSPHWFSTARRMTDVALTLAPQSAISLRLGYSRVRTEGLSGWTFHMPRGTDINPTDNQDNTTDQYRVGIDFKILPRTTISYDQFYTHSKIDVTGSDTNLFFTQGGVPTDFGISWNVPVNQPCSAAQLFTALCNQATAYSLSHRYRTSIPTEQFSFQSNPSRRIDLNGRFMYSHAHMDGTYSHLWTGKTSTGRQQSILSTPKNKRDEAAADFGARINLTERVRFLDTFRWFNWRVPSRTVITVQTWNPGSVPVTTPLVPTAPIFTFFSNFNKEARIENQSELEFDVTRAFGVRVGYRYTDRTLFRTDETFTLSTANEGPPASGDIESGQDRASATGNTGLAGIWFRPNEKLRISADGEITRWVQETGGGATGIPEGTTFGLGQLTRITPRREQQYRLRANYTPRQTVVVSGTMNINQANNNLATDSYVFHNYNGGLGVMLMPSDKYTFDLTYNFNDYLQRNLICPIGLVPGVPIGSSVLSATCPFDNTGLYQTLGRFENMTHFVSALAQAKILPRVKVGIGYSLVNSNGAELYTNPLFVPGSLKSNYHRPLALLEFELARNWFAKAGWNYYDYNEKGPGGQSLQRDFHSNSGLLSLKYAF